MVSNLDDEISIFDREKIARGDVAKMMTIAAHTNVVAAQVNVQAARELLRPSRIFGAILREVRVSQTPFHWTASFGDLVAQGFTPAEAMAEFDKLWNNREGD